MKRFLLVTAILTASVAAFGQTGGQYGPLPYHKVEETIGQKYIVLPLLKMLEDNGYTALEKQNERATKDVGFQKLFLKEIDEKGKAKLVDSAGNSYSSILINGVIPELTPLSELDDSRVKFINKTLWLNTTIVFIGDASKHELPARIPHENHRFEAVKVVGIILSDNGNKPMSFIVKTVDGKIGYVNTSVSGSNTTLNPENLFDHYFFTEDPKLKYHLTSKQWADVKANVVEVGMTLDEVILIEGHPTRINTTQTAKGTTAQYVYGEEHPTYYYLTNGKVTSIQRSN